MNTFSINVNFSSSGFDVNLFNQLDIYLSYYFATALVLLVVGLRIRKVVMDKQRTKKIHEALENIKASDNPFDDWQV
jgi:hypothetical protein